MNCTRDDYRDACNRLVVSKAKIAELDRLLLLATRRARELREKRAAWVRERRAAQADRDRLSALESR